VLLSGELNRLHEFLYQIETSIPLALIKEFSFTKNAASSGLNAKLILDFYFLLDPEEIGKVTDPVSVVTAADEKEYDRIESLSEPEVISLPRVPVGNPDLMP